jgi:L-iditol 2-dehydrogenase
MLAAYYRKPGALSLEHIECPQPQADEVQVRIEMNTICGATDTKIITGLRDRRFPRDVIMGHESAGVVTAVGERVKGFVPGDRVASMAWGTYTEMICATADLLTQVPDAISWEEASMAEITMKVYQMAYANIQPGDTVVILGQGVAGLLFTQIARLMGAAKVYVSDLYPEKLQWSVRFGADGTVNAREEDVLSAFSRLTANAGADVVIEAAGVKETVEQAPFVAKSYGATLLQFGVCPYPVSYDFSYCHDHGQTIKTMGSCKFRPEMFFFERAVYLIASGAINVRDMITQRFPLRLINDAFRLIHSEPQNVIKIAITNE